jgi:tetratricopeptide (TPR) repeat protein
MQPDLKLMLRRGNIFAALKEYDAALGELEQALKQNPNDEAVHKRIKEIKDTIESQRKLEAKRYAKMFS